MSEPRSVAELLEVGERVLADSSSRFEDHDDLYEARQLLASALRITDEEAEDLPDDLEPPHRTRERYLSFVARRAAGEPQPFIRGFIDFYGLHLKVRPGTFVPRPSSELTVAHALKRLRGRRSPVVVDLCTGAGPIALAIADERPDAGVWAADIHSDGLALGRANARDLKISNVTFKKGDMYEALPQRLCGTIDLVTGHVPYVPLDELEDLPREVKDHEPVFTLTDDTADGLRLMRRAVAEAPSWLKPGGWLLLEMSEDIGTKVSRMYKKAGFEDVEIIEDDDRLSIVVEGRLRRSPRAAR
ncbi:MAG TPA: peptide chain release factor N(5)-glutamine methyltransferase [Actinomycetota bacterium]|nr:peptide chain release factor N(5)-glutamine methyltransferase [Actinomycetota bacterium]